MIGQDPVEYAKDLERELSEAQLRALKVEAEVERLHKQIVDDAFISATNMQAAMRESDARQAEVERLREEKAALMAREWPELFRLRRVEEAARWLVDAYDRNPVGGVAVAQLRVALEEK